MNVVVVKVLFDTNILFAAILKPEGIPRKSIVKAIDFYEAYACRQNVKELNRIFATKIPKHLDRLKNFTDSILPQMKIIPVPEEEIELEKKIRDEDDRLILRAAVNAEIDIIISGDKDFLESGIRDPAILTPGQFVAWNF